MFVWLQLISFVRLLGGYIKQHNSSSCSLSNSYGRFQSKREAQAKCNDDQRCIGVLAQSCHKIDGTFRLCTDRFETAKTHEESCIFEKKHESGIYLI